jgi:hypothetical protein
MMCDPCHQHPNAREIADLLALGLMRAAARKSSRISPHTGESSLDLTPAKSGHPTRIGSEKPE